MLPIFRKLNTNSLHFFTAKPSKFQSSHPQRVRPDRIHISRDCCDFNPRTRKGCDNIMQDHRLALSISIHAPAKGATSPAKSVNSSLVISIHAPAKGATCFLILRATSFEFQSTHPQRVRRDGIR